MSNCVAELDGLLQSMQELKPPGVSGPKINQITTLCTSNIKDETVLIQKVYAHFKKAPSNKKLGVLYVVDSVSRQWLDQARKTGQTVGVGAADGTFAAGVNHVTELLPSFMSDIIGAAPEEQKVKIKKLLDIWERGTTFPAAMLSGFRTKLEAAAQSTTPPGSPPKQTSGMSQSAKPAAPVPDTASILANLQALANLPKTTATPPAATAMQGGSSNNVSYPQTTFPQSAPSVNGAYPTPVVAPAVNAPTPINGGVMSYGGAAPQNMYGGGQANAAPQPMMPQNGQQMQPAPDAALQQQLQILTALKAQGIPEHQWPALLSVLMASQNANGGNVANAAAAAIPQQFGQNNSYSSQNGVSRDSNGYDQYMRSPPSRNRRDSRSRSPVRDRQRNRSPSGRRGSPVYGDYGGARGGEDNGRNGRGRSGRGNRQRSPDRQRRSASPNQQQQQQDFGPPSEKLIEFDPSMGEGKIRVMSRTLFVGGVTCPENELRQIFARFGRVQTCIVNVDKRHAFVKMITRKESERAKVEMEHYKSDSMQLRTRWGVGFGPRPCCDYATGISTIPIDNLTDADRKWMLTAEYGGTGNKPIQSGMVVEEPDIEIGAGVSSKAISRRMQTDKSGQMGPRSTREPQGRQRGGGGGGGGGGGRDHDNPNQTPLGSGNPKSMGGPSPGPGFGMPFMQSGGAPMFQMQGQQPPPPGAT